MRPLVERLPPAALVALAAFALASAAAANSAGAPANTAVNGCICHSPQPSSQTRVVLEGLPETYGPGMEYPLTLRVTGPAPLPVPLNVGGFQIVVSAGTLAPSDGSAQALNSTALTHTSSGNDQRQWAFTWTAPDPAVGSVSFWFSGNAVNGDGTEANDAWNRGTMDVAAVGTDEGNDDGADDPSPEAASPAPGVLVALAVGIALALIGPRRRRSA